MFNCDWHVFSLILITPLHNTMYIAYGKLYMITLCSYNDLKYFEQLSVMLKYTSSFD